MLNTCLIQVIFVNLYELLDPCVKTLFSGNPNPTYMKKILLTWIAIMQIISAAFAQIQLEDTLRVTPERWRDTCFGLINRSALQIPSGYLLDYSMAAFESGDFDGLGSDSVIKSNGDFFSFYNILTLSTVNTNATLISPQDLFVNAHRYKRNTGNIPLLFLFQSYQKINQNALSNNLFSITPDSLRLLDVPGRASSPYDNKEIFMFAPLQTDINTFNAISFTLPDEFWLMPGITSVSIDFGDGAGPRTIAKGGSVSIYYAATGLKTITATISTVNGSRTALASIQYERPAYYFQPDVTWNVSVAPVYTSINDYLGMTRGAGTLSICGEEGSIFDIINCDINPGADVSVMTGCDRVFDRPIIILEGYDTDNSLTIDGMIRRFAGYDFVDEMLSAGHDLVFVNFKKPQDFIQNNAKVLEDIIGRVNAIKSGTAPGTIIGFSMGGLVARWCLRDMENRGVSHHIGKYFSYDAPHQGANIPLGLQYLFGEMSRDFEFLKWKKPFSGERLNQSFFDLVQTSKSPATRQLLVTKGANDDAAFNWSPNLSTLDPVRAKFAEELENLGYPQQAVCYGIAFGRGNNTAGTRDAGNGVQFGNFGPGSKIFEGSIIFLLANATATAYAVPENGVNDYICRYRYAGWKVVRIFGVAVGALPSIKVRNFKYTGYFPYDDAPGGYETTQSQFVDRFNDKSNNGLALPASNLGHHGHNFIPTASALDLRNQGYNAANKWQSNNMFFNIDANIASPGTLTGNNLNTPALSPFQFVQTYTSDCGAVFCESVNDDMNGDGFLDRRFDNWNQYHNGWMSQQATLFLERKILEANPWNTCPGICQPVNTISGAANLVCTTAGYELLGLNTGGLNITWTPVYGYLEITSGQGTPGITVRNVGRGIETLRVVLTNTCGQTRTIERVVTVGAPNENFSKIFNSSPTVNKVLEYCNVLLQPGQPNYYIGTVNVSDPVATNYVWVFDSRSPSNAVVNLTPNPNNQQVQVSIKTQGASGTWKLTRSNACGGFTTYHRFNSNYACPPENEARKGGSEDRFTVGEKEEERIMNNVQLFPNPAKSNVTITTNDHFIKEIKIFDVTGKLHKHRIPGAVNKTNVNINGLSAGIYFVEVTDDTGIRVIKNLHITR